jgi:hypothetical protein
MEWGCRGGGYILWDSNYWERTMAEKRGLTGEMTVWQGKSYDFFTL